MQVVVKGKILECEPLDVVRLVASAHGFVDVDVETFPDGKTSISVDGKKTVGKNRDAACERFFQSVGLT